MKDLINKLKENDVEVDVVNSELQLNVPPGVDLDDLILEVKNNKQELIAYIREIRGEEKYETIEPSESKSHYSLSSSQKRLYFLYQFDRDSLAYNMPQVVKLEGKLDRARLQAAFGQLIDRHESLRTTFKVVDNLPMQQVSKAVPFEVEYHTAKAAEVTQIIKRFIRPFDLHQAPLLRVG
ncbi:MAG: condensation domain-containing protein, partial [Bacteroidota bacterium]